MASPADRNLLFGILALQLDFITREQLVSGMNSWVLAKKETLADILQQSGGLSAENKAALDAIVNAHLKQHHNDAAQSLAAVSSIGSVKEELSLIADPQIAASIPHIAAGKQDADIFATRTAGEPSSMGTRFRILRPHAQGGLGKVFVACDGELNREVALKEIQPQYADDPAARSRFMLEAEVTGGLEHPSIVPVYGLGTYPDGRPFYAMRFIRGDSLREAIERYHNPQHVQQASSGERAIELRQLLGRFMDVCQAIQYAHDRGVLHRDLKPGNIMLGKYGETLVVDWGLAKAQGKSSIDATSLDREAALQPASGSTVEATQMGSLVGTLQYMSPEQATGRLDLLGPATDVFALGATLYHLLAGKPPYDNIASDDLVAAVREANFLPPRQVDKSVSPALNAICLKAMVREPSQRYASCTALIADVEHWLADEPVAAYRESGLVQARRWARKNPALVSGILASVVVLVGSLLAGTFVLSGKNQQLAAKEREATNFAAQAKQNEAEAVEQAAIATAVKEFLTKDLLAQATAHAQADAGSKVDPNITVRELVLQAAQRITDKFADQPRLEAEIQQTIGETLLAIGEYEASIEHLQRAVELRQSTAGVSPRELYESMAWLAVVYTQSGRIEQGFALHQETLNLRKSKFGADDIDTLKSMNVLAMGYKSVGRYDDAVELYEQTYQRMQAKFGLDHSDTLSIAGNLALSYTTVRRHEEAIALLEEALQQIRKNKGAEHPSTLWAVNNLAEAYAASGRSADALALHEQNVELFRQKLGADHPATLTCMNNLASALSDVGQHTRAVQMHQQTMDLKLTKLGLEHPDTLSSMNNLAQQWVLVGKYEQAIKLFEKGLSVQQETMGSEHPLTLLSMSNLARAYHMRGGYYESISLLRRVLEIEQSKHGPQHRSTLEAMTILAEVLSSIGNYEEALKLHEQVYAIRHATQQIDEPEMLAAANSYAKALGQMGREEEGLKLIEQTYAAVQEKLGAEHPSTLTTLQLLAEAHFYSGMPDHGFELQQQTLALRRKKMGAEHEDTIYSQMLLAEMYFHLNRLEEALAMREKLVQQMQKRYGEKHPRTLDGMVVLANVYFVMQQYDPTLKLCEQVLQVQQELGNKGAPNTLRAIRLAGLSLAELERNEEALEYFQESWQIVTKQQGPQHYGTLEEQNFVGIMRLKVKQFSNAETCLLEVNQLLLLAPETYPAHLITQNLTALIDLYKAWDKPDEIKKWEEKLQQWNQKNEAKSEASPSEKPAGPKATDDPSVLPEDEPANS